MAQRIDKVETSYYEGAPKDQPGEGDKIEVAAPDWYVRKIQREIDSKIEAEMRERTRTTVARTLFGGYDVGVIPMTSQCPSWSEKISIYMDCENTRAATHVSKCPDPATCIGAWSVDSHLNLRMIFCRVDGRSFVPLKYESYGVLKLGVNNLPKSKLLVRYFDNEDLFNGNTSAGDIAPNKSSKNTLLYIHVFEPRNTSTAALPPLSFGYKLFRGNTIVHTIVATDDEDSNNGNYATYGGVKYVAGTLSWLEAGKNTVMAIQ